MRILLVMLLALMSGCTRLPAPGVHLAREGDEILVAGQLFHTGTPVVLWLDPGGYDAYRVERRFAPLGEADWDRSRQENRELTTPNRYGMRRDGLSDWQVEQMRGGGMDLLTVQQLIDQFVVHFDVSGTSRQCFKTLHDARDLSVHFMLDLDGTIYQTLDVRERAWHAGAANSRSVGIEIANVGAYPAGQSGVLQRWYKADSNGLPYIQVPLEYEPAGFRTEGFIPRPARAEMVRGKVHGRELVQYDFTPEQYAALVKLTAALCRILPNLACTYPQDGEGNLIAGKLTPEQWRAYHGVLGHYHVQSNKVDPGPAFQWEKVISGARKLLDAE